MATPQSLEATVQMNDQAEKRGASFAIILALAVIVVAIFCVAYGLQTLAWLEARQWANANPWLRSVPQPLPSAQLPTKGEQIKSYDYEFISPWGAAEKINPTLTYSEIRFPKGQVVVFFDPDSQLDTMRTLKSATPLEYQKFQNVFIDHPIETNYALYDAVYGASPAQLSPLMSSREAMRMNVLLLWKLSFGFDTGAEIYSFDFGRNKGFQFGDPTKGTPVAARVFDDRARHHRFIFLVAAGKPAQITQDDISTVLSSLKPIPILER